MARGLVDELKYNDKGNEVKLVKYFPARSKVSATDRRNGS
jgi:hypothetical protein